MKGKILSGNKGSALALVIVIFLALSVLGIGTLAVGVGETKNVTRTENKLKAYYISRSGAQALADYLVENANDDAGDFIAVGMNDTWSSWNEQVGGGRFKVNVNNDNAKNYIIISAIGEYGGVYQTVKIKLNKVGTGVNGLFSHAIVGKEKIYTGGTANKVEITGSIASAGAIDLDIKTADNPKGKVTVSPSTGVFPNDTSLYFPAIVLPEDRGLSYTTINGINLAGAGKNNPIYPIDAGDDPNVESYYQVNLISDSNNAIVLKQATLEITGSGIVHMYVKGGIDLQTKAQITVAENAKLYIYVVKNSPTDSAEIRWSGGMTGYQNILLYAPDHNVIFQDSGGDYDMYGTVIGKQVELHNDIKFEYNSNMKNFIDIGTSESKLTFRDPIYIEN